MTTVWLTIALLAVGTFTSKALGTIVLGSHQPGERTMAMTALVAPALLAALIVYETFGDHGEGLTLDARAAGLAAAVVALIARLPMIVVILVAAAVTAGVRAFS
jgi:branched-subunit amino acid transport protein